jgi:glycolate oxidase FAD binding subunit
MADLSKELASRVESAFGAKTPLKITGAGTKSFLGQAVLDAQTLDVTPHSGIIDYDPAELVLVARSGTPLKEIESLLHSQQQMLGFEPPFVDDGATLGGAVAAGLAGPIRLYTGAVRDFMLGAVFVNGRGELITSGGSVMKNVAGFDLFRPMSRSMGTLGVLLSISLRVIPRPETEVTLIQTEKDEAAAVGKMNSYAGKTQALSGACWDGESIRIRLSGTAAGVRHGHKEIGGDPLAQGGYWQDLNNLKLAFFQQPERLWRISVAPMSDPLGNFPQQLIDWGGAQRWIKSDAPPGEIRNRAQQLGGHAECYSADPAIPCYHPLEAPALALQQRFKAAFDPAGILNPGRMHPGL